MPDASITVSDRGVTLVASEADSYDVYCDDQHVWSFTTPQRAATGRAVVPWPEPMRRFLDGLAHVRIEGGDRVWYDAETRFGTGEKRIAFRDNAGIPIMVDKWGLIQRPFTGRGLDVVDQMVDVAEEIIRVLAEECGVHCWMAFGTLLGAARSGGVIGHDSDIDLAYLSDQPTPAAMAAELFGMTRALRRAGMRVMPKSGSFITVLFGAPDGGAASIDVYTCFYLDGLLHESATVRAPVPRSAIEPLSTLSFEGRELPAPANPEAMLVASYGPDWRTPDPSFRHQPGPEVTRRFDGWFGSLMRNRREWERVLRAELERDGLAPSDFADWIAERTPPRAHVVDVGTGVGADALHLARSGWSATALDYARGSTRAAAAQAQEESLPARFEPMNLYDLRDALTQAALIRRRRPGPKVVTARRLLGALAPDGVECFWRFTSTLLGGGGTAYLEIEAEQPEASGPPGGARPRRFPVTPRAVVDQGTAAGASRVTFVRTTARLRAGTPGRDVYRFEATWPAGPGHPGRELIDD